MNKPRLFALSSLLFIACASPRDDLGKTAIVTQNVARTESSTPVVPDTMFKKPSCTNDTPETKAKAAAAAEVDKINRAEKARLKKGLKPDSRVAADLKSKDSFIDRGPKVPLVAVTMGPEETKARKSYLEELAKIESRETDRDKRRAAAKAAKDSLLAGF